MTSDSVLVVSADCHAGAPIRGYRPYLESRWHDKFDAWAASFTNPFADLDEIYANRNWDSQLRLRQLEQDGIAAEVIFPEHRSAVLSGHRHRRVAAVEGRLRAALGRTEGAQPVACRLLQ